MTFVSGSIPKEGARAAHSTADTDTLVGSAGREAMERCLVRERNEVIRGAVPKYRRFNVWDPDND
jgi:hypothetical protein